MVQVSHSYMTTAKTIVLTRGTVVSGGCPTPYRTLKTPESPLDGKEIKPVNPKGNESSIFIARTDAEAEAPIL